MNIFEVTTLLNGPRNAVVSVYMRGSIEGELVNQKILSAEDLGVPSSARLRLEYIAYNFSGFDGVLQFDTGLPTKNMKWVLVGGAGSPVDFRPFSGIRDDSPMDRTATLQISTRGFDSESKQGSMLILLKKP
jgi:hypothetical protein